MSRRPRPRRSRPYRQTLRREQAEETRRRIVAAAVELHAGPGPRHSPISAIAERAGVQRLTVYRHFPDARSLFAACSGHWAAGHPLPGPEKHQTHPAGAARTGAALAALYAYFRSNRGMIGNVLRDFDEVPELREVTLPFLAALRRYGESLADGWTVSASQRPSLLAILRHATAYPTWQSLDQAGLGDDGQKASLVVIWLEALTKGRPR